MAMEGSGNQTICDGGIKEHCNAIDTRGMNTRSGRSSTTTMVNNKGVCKNGIVTPSNTIPPNTLDSSIKNKNCCNSCIPMSSSSSSSHISSSSISTMGSSNISNNGSSININSNDINDKNNNNTTNNSDKNNNNSNNEIFTQIINNRGSDSDCRHMESLSVASLSGVSASPGCRAKYQLRPRSLQARRRSSDSEWSLQDTLRHKSRPPPLSRHRRKTANARERYRMRQINTAFESLRGVLPSWMCSRRAAVDMTKITTLRLASAYIRSLQDILDGTAPEDTCSWVVSSILGEEPKPKISKTQPASPVPQEDSDFVSLWCSSSDTELLQETLDSLSTHLSPVSESEAMALLLGSDPPRGWSDAHPTQLVT